MSLFEGLREEQEKKRRVQEKIEYDKWADTFARKIMAHDFGDTLYNGTAIQAINECISLLYNGILAPDFYFEPIMIKYATALGTKITQHHDGHFLLEFAPTVHDELCTLSSCICMRLRIAAQQGVDKHPTETDFDKFIEYAAGKLPRDYVEMIYVLKTAYNMGKRDSGN